MNYAKIENSPRLRRVLSVLHGGQWWSTREIIRKAHVCAVSAAVSEIRANGIPVECRKRGGLYEYKLT